ncbi:type I secretion C-terminal target domain-containing protein [Limimaricola cinnabarinus]|uniref:Peptidase M10 serralysin C-terminal domain-containing protein n=1 Tax=Limimaricola cinnabarinus TaxID=1125964 RepID=A0A2G1MJH8_9RHOB|nr:type I secretion C-terminal target domain-containing protein [Limimaricola cinnabarinus]PHP28906.1 hypothetical protein CJ301_04195 [Limimaricola cinnabarinus]
MNLSEPATEVIQVSCRTIGGGDDALSGGAGRDTLKGGKGGDEITGGRAGDTMVGGGGADQFIFGARDAGAGRRKQDVVRDFDRSEGDKIDLSDIDGNSHGGGNQKLDWIGRNADFTEAGQVRFDSARGRPEINTDNDARAEMRIVLNGVDAFGAQDLLL